MFMIPKTFSSVNLLAQILFMASSFIHKKENQKTNDLPFLSKMVGATFLLKNSVSSLKSHLIKEIYH